MIGIRAISIYDSSGTKFQIDGHSIESSGDPFTKTQIGKGRALRYDYTLSFSHSDHEAHASILDDSDYSGMNWRASVAYFDGFLVWETDSWLEVSERSTSDPMAALFPYKLTLRRSGNHKIALARNLVRAWQIANGNGFFADSDSNNIADGFTNDGMVTPSFGSGEQSVTWDAGTNKIYLDITFPVSGLALTGGFNFSAFDADFSMHMEDQDSGGTAGTTDTNALAATGYATSAITTASDVYKIRLEVRGTGNGTVTFSEPFIRLNGGGFTNS